MVGEDLDAGADDEDQEEQVEEVLPSQPGGEACRSPGARLDGAGVLPDEPHHRGVSAQALGDGDRDNE
jgi:hypothetical protein